MPQVATIGDVALSSWIGTLVLPSERVERIQRAGIPGAVFRLIGKQGEAVELRVQTDADSQTDAEAAEQNLQALAGTLVTIVDPFNRMFENVMVYGPVLTRITKPGVVVGGVTASPTHVIRATIRVELTEDYYI